ncbi:LamG domain-containing protein [Myxococcota bacterium]|nr:LamG domain-containing protein [Myxococcota bacterium]
MNKAADERGLDTSLLLQMFLLLALILLFSGCGGTGQLSSSDTAPSTQESVVGEPVSSSNARVVSMRWIASSSSGITRYDVLVGTSPGAYQAKVEVPRQQAGVNGEGVYSYSLTLRKDLDYYVSMQAYDGRLLSAPSNEIILAATTPPAPFGSSASSTRSMPAASPSAATVGSASGLVQTPTSSEQSRSVAQSSLPQGDDSIHSDSTSSSRSVPVSRFDLASLELDGEQDYLGSDRPEELGAVDALSLSIWMRPFIDTAARRVLLELSPSSSDPEGLGLRLSLLDGENLECLISDADGELHHRALYALSLANDSWQHLAVVLDPAIDNAPRVLLDGFEADLLLSEGRGREVELTALTGFLRVGGSGVTGEKGFLGRLGHLAMWRDALSPAAFSEIQRRAHEVDVRDPVGVYAASDSLIHYWRLGESSQSLGYDLGFADRPLDLDDPAGGVTQAAFVEDGPTSLIAP